MPAAGAAALGVVCVRCIGCAVVGAVCVDGGAEAVLDPRLPEEEPPPARASATPGARAIARAAVAARKKPVRRMALASLFFMTSI
jgi:hypothetical protein